MRARSLEDPSSRCPRCLLQGEACVCAVLPVVQTRTHFLILRHIIESRRSTNTGWVASLALPNSTLLDVGGGPAVPEAPLRAPGSWLLFPGFPPLPQNSPPPRQVVVLDGTWKQARKLLLRVPALRGLPKLSLPPPESPPVRMRRQTVEGGMSTLEAIAAAVAHFEGHEQGARLSELYHQMARRALAVRGRRHG